MNKTEIVYQTIESKDSMANDGEVGEGFAISSDMALASAQVRSNSSRARGIQKSEEKP